MEAGFFMSISLSFYQASIYLDPMFRRKDDQLLKSAFEDMFPEFLRFDTSEADVVFDMECGFDFIDKELQEIMPQIQHPGGNMFVDMLVKVWLRNGKEEWILSAAVD